MIAQVIRVGDIWVGEGKVQVLICGECNLSFRCKKTLNDYIFNTFTIYEDIFFSVFLLNIY